MKEILEKVNSNWSKDLIIRYLYVKLAPYFERDLDYFLSDREVKLKMYKEGFKQNSHLVVCKTICEIYQTIYKVYNIESRVIVTENKEISHYGLIVHGDYGWYYLDPLKDLFVNQLGLKTQYFGITPDLKLPKVKEDYPFLIDLPETYIEKLDLELGLIPKPNSYLNTFFDILHNEITSDIANDFFNVPKGNHTKLIIEKLLFMNKFLINMGNIPGLCERTIFYKYLISCIFDIEERKKISANIITKDLIPNIQLLLAISSKEIRFEECKNKNGVYYLKMIK